MAWTPYGETLIKALEPLCLAEQERAGGFVRYQADKLANVALGSIGTDEVHRGVCCIIPRPEFVLPIYVSLWEERRDTVRMLVDLMPTVDTLVDETFRVRYLEPMGSSWERFAALAGIGPEEDDELRSACSIIYTAAQVPIDKEGMRLAALAPHVDYLKRYAEHVQSAAPVQDETKLQEVRRRTVAVQSILTGHVKRRVSDVQMAHTICSICF
jgi:hypothetical protein